MSGYVGRETIPSFCFKPILTPSKCRPFREKQGGEGMKRTLMMVVALALFCQAAPGEALQLVGQIGGSTRTVAVRGPYAYVNVGPRLLIVDVSDQARPEVVGETPPLPGLIYSIALAGDYVYAGVFGAGV